jgi:hypothetical protein
MRIQAVTNCRNNDDNAARLLESVLVAANQPESIALTVFVLVDETLVTVNLRHHLSRLAFALNETQCRERDVLLSALDSLVPNLPLPSFESFPTITDCLDFDVWSE